MVSAINIAVTGLMASSKRLANSANNVANVHSTHSRIGNETVREPFKPQEVQQTSLDTGGVRTHMRDKDPATFPIHDPTNDAADADGIVQYPNVDLAEEAVEQISSKHVYEANLNVIKAEDEMLGNLLDITS